MDVVVHYKRQQWWLHSAPKTSILGKGLLERARSTSLALLGLTAAVGLAMVALALNQGWPLIAGAPIPGFGDRQQAVGDATVAAAARAPRSNGAMPRSIAGQQSPKASTRPKRKSAGGTRAPAVPRSPGSEGIVASHPIPVSSPGDVPPSAEGSPGPAAPDPLPAAQQPAATVAPSPEPEPASSPAAPSASPAPQASSKSSTPGQAAFVSDENDGHGHSHRYGRGTSHSYGHSRSRDDSDASNASESSEAPGQAPSPSVEPPVDSNTTEDSEDSEGQSSPPTWSHGGGHAYGHDYDHHH
jgi:hypothetical protein